MNLRICVLPAKVLKDGSHKIRIAISHKGATRYFVTRFTVPSESNVSNGRVVGVDNASYINKQLTMKVSRIFEAYDKIEDSEYLSCSQLVAVIEDNLVEIKPKTITEIATEYLKTLTSKGLSKNSIYIYSKGLEEIKKFFGNDFLVKNLNTAKVNAYMNGLKGHLNDTTVNIRMRFLKLSVSYAVRHKYVKFDVSPFEDVHIPKSKVRDCVITIEELRKIRDWVIPSNCTRKNMGLSRDIFMASFYLCGMNMADLISIDLSGDEVSFTRAKTSSRKQNPRCTTFTIQPEAREYLNKIFVNGKIKCTCRYDANSLTAMVYRNLQAMAKELHIDTNLIFYSARKTFAQLANELMIKDSIIEYCIGDTPTTNSKVIGHYININKRMADIAIRKVFDAVASNKSIDELVNNEL